MFCYKSLHSSGNTVRLILDPGCRDLLDLVVSSGTRQRVTGEGLKLVRQKWRPINVLWFFPPPTRHLFFYSCVDSSSVNRHSGC